MFPIFILVVIVVMYSLKSIKYVDLIFKFISGNFSYLYLLELKNKDIKIT